METTNEDLEEAVHEYLSRALTALRTLCEVAGDAEYLKKYPPSQLALLHSVMADKVVRLIEIMGDTKTDYV